jgi:hypothetical protein
MKSELFKNSYCIFINKDDKQIYKNIIDNYKNLGVRMLEGDFENAPLCVVIPNLLDIFKLEKELFDLNNSKNGFWGQFGMGYEGKEWKEIYV